MMRVAVTGATGFLGRRLLETLAVSNEFSPFAIIRQSPVQLPSRAVTLLVQDIGPNTPWRSVLCGIDVVVHAAGRVHVARVDNSPDAWAEFRRGNVLATLNLARQAAAAGVERFIFISSIKVNGDNTRGGHRFTAQDEPKPSDAYAVSKLEAERELRRVTDETGMELVVIRPPLIYGPGVKANFLSMMNWIYRRIPLPLASIVNLRSLIALDNLVDLIVLCVTNDRAANETFLASDGEDLSTPDLLKRLGAALHRDARLFKVPPRVLDMSARLAGRPDIAARLWGSLQIDMTKTRHLLGWKPIIGVDEGLRRVAKAYLERIG